jgi:hypothetical protein
MKYSPEKLLNSHNCVVEGWCCSLPNALTAIFDTEDLEWPNHQARR